MRLDQLIPTIAELTADDVQIYLRTRGWFPVGDVRDVAVVYGHEGREQVMVPLDRTLGDYARVLGELVDTLSKVERRSPFDVTDDLSTPPGDLVSFRVDSELVSSGTVPLLDALRIRESQRDMILSAAHSVVMPLPYFPRLGRAEPVELLARCREAQTARGSYITRLIVPVEPAVGRLPLEDPYGRRVTRLLMDTLSSVQQRLVRADPEGLLEAPPRGLSYNLLTALAAMKPPGERSNLEIGVRWSRGRARPEAPSRVSFSAPQFEHMRPLAAVLRERAPTTCELEGYVTRLSRAGNQPAVEGEVVVLAGLGDQSAEARVHMILSPDDYKQKAMLAHAEGRPVKVSGVLRRDGRRWRLDNPAGFEVLPGEDDQVY